MISICVKSSANAPGGYLNPGGGFINRPSKAEILSTTIFYFSNSF